MKTDTAPTIIATANDVISLSLVRRLAALLDLPADTYAQGDVLPHGWHVVAFGNAARQSALEADGHSRAADSLPELEGFPNRMLAGRRLTFHAPLHIGMAVDRSTELLSVERKTGRTGPLAFVRVRHSISQEDRPLMEEIHDIVYRNARGAANPQEEARPVACDRYARPDAAMLFRFSAISFNSHRIHYDSDYARNEEGYPGLVVNGGLTALFVCEFAKRINDAPLARFTTRHRAPAFLGDRIGLRVVRRDGASARLEAVNDRGTALVEADAEYAA